VLVDFSMFIAGIFVLPSDEGDVRTGSSISVTVTHALATPGFRLVYAWFTPVYAWFTPDVHPISTGFHT
jgi:hypothetical protein